MVGEERLVGETEDNFLSCWDFNFLKWRGDGSCAYLLISFFFFCIHAFIVSRYKKPYATRATEKIKPIRQNHCPLHVFMGKFKPPETIGKVSPA